MKMRSIIKFNCLSAGLIAAVALVLASCEEESQTSEEEIPQEVPAKIVSFLTEDGGEANIYQFEDGAILIHVMDREKSAPYLEDYSSGKMDLLDFYVAITGEETVPNEVIEMANLWETKLAENRDRSQEEDAPETMESCADTAATDGTGEFDGEMSNIVSGGMWAESLTAQQFIENKCFTVGHWLKCQTNQTGDCYHSDWVDDAYSRLYVYRGSISHRLNRKIGSDWTNLINHTVTAGYYSWMHYQGSNDYIKIHVWEASGDGYHHSAATWG